MPLDARLRQRLGHADEPRFARHTAWRALVPADGVVSDLSAPVINLWFGRHAHLVYYPVRGGSLINVVAIVRDDWRELGWSAPGERTEILARYPAGMWPAAVRPLPSGDADPTKGAAMCGALRLSSLGNRPMKAIAPLMRGKDSKLTPSRCVRTLYGIGGC